MILYTFHLSYTMSSTTDFLSHYTTYTIMSWYRYQQITLHSIAHYYAQCEEDAKLHRDNVMVLREEVTRISGWHWCSGWAAQNCADTDGYVDVRTGKKYPYGKSSFCEDIGYKRAL
jgi:hypothetical protein